MKAFILAAGLGTRLKPLTDRIPKALVPIGEQTLLEICIRKLIAAGVSEIIINICHHADQIVRFVEKNCSFGVKISFSDERDELLETGGALKKAAHLFDSDEPFFVHNVDILSNIDLKALYLSHLNDQAIATLAMNDRTSQRVLLFDEKLHLRGWRNNKTGELRPSHLCDDKLTPFAFAGIHVISPRLLDSLDTYPKKFSIIDTYLDLCTSHPIVGYTQSNLRILDVGKLDTLEESVTFLKSL